MATRRGGGMPGGFSIQSYQGEVEKPKPRSVPAPPAAPPPSPKSKSIPSAPPPPPAKRPLPPPPPAKRPVSSRPPAQTPVPPPPMAKSPFSRPPPPSTARSSGREGQPVKTVSPQARGPSNAPATGKPLTATDFKHIPLFQEMSEPQIKVLIHQAKSLTLNKNEVVFREGAKENTLFLLQMGRCEVAHAGRPVASLGAGTVFGEMALVSNQPRSASITAQRLSTFKVWDPDTLLAVFDLDPEIGILLYRNIAKVLAQRLKRANTDKRNLG